MTIQIMNHLSIVSDCSSHSIVITSKHRLPIIHTHHTHLAMELNLSTVTCLRTAETQLVNQLHAKATKKQTCSCKGWDDGIILDSEKINNPYHFIEFRKEYLNVAQHAAHCTVSREMRLRPNISIHTIPFLLILKIESRNRRMVITLLSHVTDTTLRCVYNTREGFSNNGIVRFLTTMSLVMPTGQIPFQ